ncbi:RidA family protein [Chthonobacter albigriseus]|uniref:RidA family protein n=1 Tax=Chthonobacter albigriseus TaxID=1683161 RepID=UPI0015EEF89C|nr:RidA family protein [Chthonobacter albigriseus]
MSTERRYIAPADTATETAPYSQAVVAGGTIYVAGQIAQDHPDWAGRHGTIEEETEVCLTLIQTYLEKAGASMADVVKVTVLMADLEEFERMNTVYARFFPAGRRPVRTTTGAGSLLYGCRIEIDCIAVRQ